MAKTRHIHQRMGQRGITQRMVDIVMGYGVFIDDKCVLDRCNIDELIKGMDRLRGDLLKIRDKGGVVVVEDGGAEITTYNYNSFNRRKAANS